MAELKSKFASNSQEWKTPTSLFRPLDREFNFTLDVCASEENSQCKKFYSLKDNALNKKWKGVCWMNPPFNKVGDWVAKAYRESRRGAVVVCLIPARTNTGWWHDIVLRKKAEVRFIRGRPKFSGQKHGLPQPLAIVIFGTENMEYKRRD